MNSKLSSADREACSRAVLNGDAQQLEQFLISFHNDPFIRQWDEAIKAHSKESAGYYDKACTIIAYKHYFNNWTSTKNLKQH